jgi:hypothetical protein
MTLNNPSLHFKSKRNRISITTLKKGRLNHPSIKKDQTRYKDKRNYYKDYNKITTISLAQNICLALAVKMRPE